MLFLRCCHVIRCDSGIFQTVNGPVLAISIRLRSNGKIPELLKPGMAFPPSASVVPGIFGDIWKCAFSNRQARVWGLVSTFYVLPGKFSPKSRTIVFLVKNALNSVWNIFWCHRIVLYRIKLGFSSDVASCRTRSLILSSIVNFGIPYSWEALYAEMWLNLTVSTARPVTARE